MTAGRQRAAGKVRCGVCGAVVAAYPAPNGLDPPDTLRAFDHGPQKLCRGGCQPHPVITVTTPPPAPLDALARIKHGLFHLVPTNDRDQWLRDVDTIAAVLARLTALEAENTNISAALAEAASEINVAGPVAHRIRVMRQEYADQVNRLEAAHRDLVAALPTIEQLREIEWSNTDGTFAYCPACHQWDKHAPDCWIARLLAAQREP